MWRPEHALFAASLALTIAADACAAGGHFDVDDATVLEPGHCQYEIWAARVPDSSASVFHLGPGCRVGPLELGVNFDRLRAAGDSRSPSARR